METDPGRTGPAKPQSGLFAKLELFEANAEIDAERQLASLSYDPSAEGEGLRKNQMTCLNRFFRGMETFRKYQAGTRGKGRRTGRATPHVDGDSSRLSETDAAQERNALAREWGVISGNSTSEADFAEVTSVTETPYPIEVATNSGDISGLDKVTAQPVESNNRRLEQVRGSAIEDGGLKTIHSTSGGRVDERVPRASFSNREQKRLRGRKERKALE